MADIETNIGINLDTSNALAAIKNLQREISAFHSTLAKGSSTAAAASASLQKDLINNLNATGQFSASMTTVRSTTESFTNALEKNKLSMGEYFRYAGGASRNFGKYFSKEFDTINKVARERVKDLQTQYIQLGRSANGALQAIKVRPMVLDLQDSGTQLQIAAQKQQIFNELLKQGSTNLLNFGKNTQWAGRQLMVGFTIPLSIFGNTAARTFMELEKQAIRFKRVYGELFTSPEETNAMVKALQDLSLEFTKYGVAVEKTMSLAADAAAMGKTGQDLLAQVTEANRLAVLGNVEQAQALETTISVTNAFGVATADLASKIDFLNAVENQTVTSIEDLTIAIPKAGPVIQQLGGDVEDLAFFLTAMKEGGINASEGANALKSGLASLINPTGRAAEMLAGFGINIKNIVEANKGDVKGLVIDFANALDTLDPLNRAQAIEQLFGKFQFSRLSTLFQNVIAEGTQAERVLELTNATVQELAQLSEKELGNVAESTTFKFQKAVEELRAAIAPIGEQFLKAITPILEFATDILNKFNSMNEGVKNFVVIGGALIAGLGPVFLMTFGLIANGIANIIKGFATVRGWFQKTGASSTTLGEQFDYMTREQLEAAAVASSLERAHMLLEQRFTSEKQAVEKLIEVYQRAIAAKNRFSTVPGVGPATGMKLASGIVSVPGPKGAGDIVPAMLSPGEAVIPAEMAKRYAPLIQGMIAGSIPGFAEGIDNVQAGQRTSQTSRAITSHFDITSPLQLASTISQAAKYLNDSFIELFTVVKSSTDNGYEVVKSQTRLIDAAKDTNVSMFAGGAFHGGTAAVGPSDRNEMFNRIGIAGEPFTLDALIDASKKAAEELSSGSEVSRVWSSQLQELAEEGSRGEELLRSSNDQTQTRIQYMKSNAKKAIQESLLADKRIRLDGKKVTVETASQEADRRLLDLDKRLIQLKTEGINNEQLLQEAQDMLIAEMLASSTGQFTVAPATGYGAKAGRDVARNMIRSSGPFAVARPEFSMPYRGGFAPEVAEKEAKSLVSTGEDVTRASMKAIASGAKKALRMASPSREMQEIGENAGRSFADSVEKTVQAYKIPNSRRVVTDINVYNAAMEKLAQKQKDTFAKIIQQHNMLGESVKGYLTKIAGSAGPSFDIKTRQQVPGSSEAFKDFNSNLMALSFAFSSLSTVTTMFGGEIGFINEALYGLSNTIFAISGLTYLITAFKGGLIGSIVATAQETVARINHTRTIIAENIARTFSGGFFAGLKNIGGKLVGVFQMLMTKFGRFLPYIGWAIAAFSVFQIFASEQQKQKDKLNAMGNAAFAAGQKLKDIANLAGFEPTRDPGLRYQQSADARKQGLTQEEAGMSAAKQAEEQFITDTSEGGKFYALIQELKTMTTKEAEVALQSLMVELMALAPEGVTPAVIKSTVAAIADVAGQGDIKLELPLSINPYQAGNEEIVKKYISDLVKKIKTDTDLSSISTDQVNKVFGEQFGIADTPAFTQEQRGAARTFGSAMTASIEQLNTQLQAGKLSVEDYYRSMNTLLSELRSFPYPFVIEATNQMFTNFGVPQNVIDTSIKGITDITSRILALDALSVGVGISDDDFKVLDAADDLNATETEINAARIVTNRIMSEYNRILDEQAAAIEAAKDAEVARQATVDLQAIRDQIDLNRDILEAAPELVQAGLDEAEAYKLLGDEKYRNILLDALRKDQEDPEGGTTNVDAAIAAIKELNDLEEERADKEEKANAPKALSDYIKDLEDEAKLKKDLENAGIEAADAQMILNSEVLKGAAAAAIGTPKWNDFLAQLEKYKKLVPSTTGGTKELTPFEKAIEQLKDQRKELMNTSTAFIKLRDAGVSVSKAFRIAKDPILAAALAAEKVGTKKWKELVNLINKFNAQAAVAELRALTAQNIAEADAANNIATIEKYLNKLGYTSEQIEKVISQIGDNPDVLSKIVTDLKDGKINAQSIRDYLASIKNIKVELTIEDMESKVNQAFSDIAAAFAAKREQIDLDFELGTNVTGKNKINPLTGLPYNTTAIKKSIKEAQDYISERQYKIDDYEYQLVGIQDKEDKINESYDKRIKALDEIQRLNEKNAQIGKDQLNVANALATGDIAAAAAAVQEARQNQANRAIEDQRNVLESAKEAELAAVRAANGMSRIEIESKIKELKDEILKKEEETLEPQERALELAEGYRDAANQSVTYLDKNETEWKKIENGVRLAKIEAEGYKKAIEDALALIPGLTAAYGASGSKSQGPKVDPKQQKIDELNAKIQKNRDTVNKDKSITANDKKLMSENVKLINELRTLTGDPNTKGGIAKKATGGLIKRFAAGGFAMGTDTVPAMLTPGEFVVRKYAVKDFGLDRLKSINNGTYTGSSVYNYELNINMSGTDLSADDVARTVISKIKQIDSQRIRGNSF